MGERFTFKKHFVSLILIFGIGLVGWPMVEKYSQSFRFVDEEEHFVIGSLINKGYRLYLNVVSNHQPINYLGSAIIQSVFQPNSIYLLVKRHREVLYLWQLFWIFLLIKKFKFIVIPAIFLVEIVKYFRLGHLFLAESIVAYPLTYLYLGYYSFLIHKRFKLNEYFIGLIMGFIILTLIPLLLPLGVLVLIGLIKFKEFNWKKFIFGGLTVLGLVLIMVDLRGYWIWTIYNNFHYQVPELTLVHTFWDGVKMGLLPVLALGEPNSLLVWINRLIMGYWLMALIFGVYFRQRNKLLGLGLIFFTWCLTNTRDLHINRYYYEGFHLFPLMVSGLVTAFFALGENIISLKRYQYRWLWGGLIVCPIFILTLQPNSPLLNRMEPMTDNYVQYTPIFEATQVINSLKTKEDKLMTLPVNSILHWTTDIPPATRQITYYHWMYRDTASRIEYFDTLFLKPPSFIQFTDDGSNYCETMRQLIGNKYTLVYRSPDIYIRTDKIKELPVENIRKFRELPYTRGVI